MNCRHTASHFPLVRSAPRVASYCVGGRVGCVLLLGERGCVRAVAPSPRLRRAVALGWGPTRVGGVGRHGGWGGARSNTCPRTPRLPCRLRAHCESRDAICRWARVATRLRVGTRLTIGARHGCGSGGALVSPSHCSDRPRCVDCVDGARAAPSSSRVRVLPGVRDRRRQARCAAAASSCHLLASAVPTQL